jgi:hypothetical protein
VILKGKERGNGKQLATYLLSMGDNEHVALHHLRGFSSSTLKAALQEIDAISRGTRARNTMFSLSLNPPPQERVSAREFENAIAAVEKKLGLAGQPRAVIFHEKDGRRHAHVVWSRIESKEMKAINLPHFKLRLQEVSRQIFLDHGWQLPKGLISRKERDLGNYSRKEWEQAKRANLDPKTLKRLFVECWAASDNAKSFAQALRERGFSLARGDQRGHVAVDFRGQVYAVSKWAGVKTKEVRSRLGDLSALPTVAEVTAQHAEKLTEMLQRHIAEIERTHEKQTTKLLSEKNSLVDRQRQERAALDKAQGARWTIETSERSKRLARGLRGIWHRLTGEHREQVRLNEREALQCLRRDRLEKDDLVFRHVEQREKLHQNLKAIRTDKERDISQLHRDVAEHNALKGVRNSHSHENSQKPSLEKQAARPQKPRSFE